MSDVNTPKLESKFCEVLGSQMHYLEAGTGDPILFIHGNPTSSYLWRNIMPHVAGQGRCIAVDLIGMGKSDKPDIEYRYDDHYKYLSTFIETMGLKNLTLVVHDWGSGLGFHYAASNPGNIKGIAFMEALVKPMEWSEFPKDEKIGFKLFRTPFTGWLMISVFNMFLKQMLPKMILRKLKKEEVDAYEAPYQTIASRKPVRVWPEEVPIGGLPAHTHKIISDYSEYLKTSPVPKLMIHVEPGAIINPEVAAWCKASFKNLESVFVGKGLHFFQEDHPNAIGKAISAWVSKLKG